MSDPSSVESKTVKQVTKKVMPVKSRHLDYLDTTAKCSSSGSSTGTGKMSTVITPRLAKGSKTSTPTKEISLFDSDISVVPSARPACVKEKLSEDISEVVFMEYNIDLLLRAMQCIVRDEHAMLATSADKELSAQQKMVSEAVCTLSDVRKQIDATLVINKVKEDLAFHESYIDETLADSAMREAKVYVNISEELEEIQSQLLCKNVRLPKSQQDIDEITDAATELAKRLTLIQTHHSEDMKNTANAKHEMSTIDTLSNNLRENTESAKQLMPAVTTTVLKEISDKMVKAGLSNFTVKF